jgi:hypothetical protein
MSTSDSDTIRVMSVTAKLATDTAILAVGAVCALTAGLLVTSHPRELGLMFGVSTLIQAATYRWLFREIAVPERAAARAASLPERAERASVASYAARWLLLFAVIPPVAIALVGLYSGTPIPAGAIAGMWAGVAITTATGLRRHRRYAHLTGIRLAVRSQRGNLAAGDYFIAA